MKKRGVSDLVALVAHCPIREGFPNAEAMGAGPKHPASLYPALAAGASATWRIIKSWEANEDSWLGLRRFRYDFSPSRGEYRTILPPDRKSLRAWASLGKQFVAHRRAMQRIAEMCALGFETAWGVMLESNEELRQADYTFVLGPAVAFGFYQYAHIIGTAFWLAALESADVCPISILKNSEPLLTGLANSSKRVEPTLFEHTGLSTVRQGYPDPRLAGRSYVRFGLDNPEAFILEKMNRGELRLSLKESVIDATVAACADFKETAGNSRMGCLLLYAMDEDGRTPLLLSFYRWMLRLVERFGPKAV